MARFGKKKLDVKPELEKAVRLACKEAHTITFDELLAMGSDDESKRKKIPPMTIMIH